MAGKRTLKAKSSAGRRSGSSPKRGSAKPARAKAPAKKPAAAKKAKPAAKPKPKPAKAKKAAKPQKPAKAHKAAKVAAPKAKAQPAKVQKAPPKAAPPKSPPPKPEAPKAKVAIPAAKPSKDKLVLKPAAPPAAPSSAGKILPPPRQSKRGGETLTLVPARSSQPGDKAVAPRGAPPRGSVPKGGAPSGRAQAARSPSGAPLSSRGVTLVRRPSDRPMPGLQAAALPIPVRKVEAAPSLEDRFSKISKRLEALDEATRSEFYRMFDQAWVSHDSALEGVVYTREEILAGFSADPILTDSSLQPAADEIRRHREAIEYVRDFGLHKRLPITVDVIKKIYLILHPSEGDLKTVKYRRDVPQHRLYFHEYAPPDKIAYKVRNVVDWLNEPETRKTRNALRIAASAHYNLVRIFPFQSDSGKVARLFMNMLLFRSGFPPAIVHAKERQNYYDALKGEPNKILRIVQDSVEDGLTSIEKLLDEQETKKRPFVS